MILANSNSYCSRTTDSTILSVTVRLNIRDVVTVGAVNVGVAVFAPVSDTGVPDVCTHEYDTIVPPFGE